MEILIVVCLAVLVSVFIVKFCIKGEFRRIGKRLRRIVLQ
mgnify:CR=1 FL=1